jgi:hypothetical protein
MLSDPLMRNPGVFLDRVKKYRQMHIQYQNGENPSAQFKYFPEFFKPIRSRTGSACSV